MCVCVCERRTRKKITFIQMKCMYIHKIIIIIFASGITRVYVYETNREREIMVKMVNVYLCMVQNTSKI